MSDETQAAVPVECTIGTRTFKIKLLNLGQLKRARTHLVALGDYRPPLLPTAQEIAALIAVVFESISRSSPSSARAVHRDGGGARLRYVSRADGRSVSPRGDSQRHGQDGERAGGSTGRTSGGLDFAGLYGLIITTTGWTMPVVDALTLFEVDELAEYWATNPPLHIAVAAFLGVKGERGKIKAAPGASDHMPSLEELQAFAAHFSGGHVRQIPQVPA